MKTVKINVTQKHINKGKRGKCHSCPITIALFEATELLWNVYPLTAIVFQGNNKNNINRIEYEVILPTIASDFVRDFDMGKPVEPFEFEISY